MTSDVLSHDWKQVGPLHFVTPEGRVWSTHTKRFLREGLGTNGRPAVNIRTWRDKVHQTRLG